MSTECFVCGNEIKGDTSFHTLVACICTGVMLLLIGLVITGCVCCISHLSITWK